MSDNQIHTGLSPEMMLEVIRTFDRKFRSVTGSDAIAIEAIIKRDDLFPKITELVNDGPVSLWTLFEKLATPLNAEQAAVLYALEEMWGMGDIEHANEEHLTEFVTAHEDVASVGSPAWFRGRVDDEEAMAKICLADPGQSPEAREALEQLLQNKAAQEK